MSATPYRILRQDASVESWTVRQLEGVEPAALLTGAPLEAPVQPLRITLAAWGKRPSDFLELPCFVVSSALRAALQDAGVDNIEYFPVELAMEFREQPIAGYWLGNVLGLVSCVDANAAGLEAQEELGSFEVDVDKSHGLSLFRVAEDPRLVVISARVHAALQARALRGLLFQETHDYAGMPISSTDT